MSKKFGLPLGLLGILCVSLACREAADLTPLFPSTVGMTAVNPDTGAELPFSVEGGVRKFHVEKGTLVSFRVTYLDGTFFPINVEDEFAWEDSVFGGVGREVRRTGRPYDKTMDTVGDYQVVLIWIQTHNFLPRIDTRGMDRVRVIVSEPAVPPAPAPLPDPPTVELLADGQRGSATVLVSPGQTGEVTLFWDPEGLVTEAKASGAWSGSKSLTPSQEVIRGLAVGDYRFTITVNGPGGQDESSVLVRVVLRDSPPPPPPQRFAVTTAIAGLGTVVLDPPQPENGYEAGTSVSATAIPASAWRFDGWSEYLAGAGTTNPTGLVVASDLTIQANFSQPPPVTYLITASAELGGSINPSGQVLVNQGANQTFTITANAGHYIYRVLVNGQSLGVVSSYTFADVQANASIQALFREVVVPNRYHLYLNSTGGGTATASPSQPDDGYEGGTQVTLRASPLLGYRFVGWSGDFSGNQNPATITMDGNKTVTANFTRLVYVITASAGPGGTISPVGERSVLYGDDLTFTIGADAGYYIYQVLVNGASVGAVSSYTFADVQANASIQALFREVVVPNRYHLYLNSTGGGTATASPVQPSDGYEDGTRVTLRAFPDHNHRFLGWSGDLSGDQNPVTITVNRDKTITANFEQLVYVITASAGPGGTISPAGSVTVVAGSSQAFTITPNAGYLINQVLVNGVNAGAITGYTFPNVQAGATIQASFRLAPPTTFTITASAGPGGSINPSGQVLVNQGANQTFSFTPNAGYQLYQVFIDGTQLGVTESSYTFTQVQAEHTIRATFRLITIPTHVIRILSGMGGSTTATVNGVPAQQPGDLVVAEGDTVVVSFWPEHGYGISELAVDGVNRPIATSYTFNNVTDDHTLVVNFSLPDFSVEIGSPLNDQTFLVDQAIEFSVNINGVALADIVEIYWDFPDGTHMSGGASMRTVSKSFPWPGRDFVWVDVTDRWGRTVSHAIWINIVHR